jgi:FkbM family methyltransferase
MKRLLEQLLRHDRVGLVDVGGSGGPEPRWRRLDTRLRHYVFEPDPRSFEKLTARSSDDYKVYDAALASERGSTTFHLCREPQVSSILPPNRDLVDEFPRKERWDIATTRQIQTSRLDDVLTDELSHVDFIKIDTQGTELSVVRGARHVLGHVFGAEIEVSFVEIYKDQDLFGDICRTLGDAGLVFMDFTNLCRWERQGPTHTLFGQCVFGDAVFLKHPNTLAKELATFDPVAAASKARRYAAILVLYNRGDLLAISRNVLSAHLQSVDPILKKIDRRLRIRRRMLDAVLRIGSHVMARVGFRPFPLQAR